MIDEGVWSLVNLLHDYNVDPVHGHEEQGLPPAQQVEHLDSHSWCLHCN